MSAKLIGVDVGGTKVSVAVLEGSLLHEPRILETDTRDGQLQYAYADPETCKCLYVGDEQRYQKFQELSLQKKIADERMSAAHANWEASMNYWGVWGPLGF